MSPVDLEFCHLIISTLLSLEIIFNVSGHIFNKHIILEIKSDGENNVKMLIS